MSNSAPVPTPRMKGMAILGCARMREEQKKKSKMKILRLISQNRCPFIDVSIVSVGSDSLPEKRRVVNSVDGLVYNNN